MILDYKKLRFDLKAKMMTTKQATITILRCHWTILRNLGRAINHLVTAYPWPVIAAITIISIVMNIVTIGRARAERDGYNRQNVQLKEKLNTANNLVEIYATTNND